MPTAPRRLTTLPLCALIALVVCAPAGSCGRPQRKPESSSETPALLPRVAETAPGATAESGTIEWILPAGMDVVVPLDPEVAASLRQRRISLSDGGSIEANVYVLRLRRMRGSAAPDPTSVAAKAGWWLGLSAGGDMREWVAEELRPGQAVGEGVSVVLVNGAAHAPRSGSSDGELGGPGGPRVRIRWLTGPEEPGESGVFARVLGEEAWQSAQMRAAITLAERSPRTRWRARLAMGALRTTAEKEDASAPALDPVVESLARTIERQWEIGLARLAQQDAVLARRVIERLCGSLDFGGGVFVPAWTPDDDALAELLDALLREDGTGITDAAQGWLGESAPVLCWVVDDAGGRDPETGEPVGTAGVANLAGEPFAAWAEPDGAAGEDGAAGAPEIVAVPPWSVRRLTTPRGESVPLDRDLPPALAVQVAQRGQTVLVHTGESVHRPTFFTAPAPALAPGVLIRSLHPDWRMSEWTRAGSNEQLLQRAGPWGDGDDSSAGWRTSGLIYWGVDAPLESGVSPPNRWLLFLELNRPGARRQSAEEMVMEEFVRVWFGPFGRGGIVLRVMPDGRVIDESPARSDDVPRLARAAATPNGWTCWVPIPASAIEADGILRVGIERVDERGVRSTWPRPSLPWQREPARLAIDTRLWTRD